MTKLVPTLPHFAAFGQYPIHATDRTKVDSFIQQGGEGFRWRLVPKAFRVQVV
jgi:hypothetical protein